MATNAVNTIVLPKKGSSVTTSVFLPDGFQQDANGNVFAPGNIMVKTFDANSNAYQLTNGKWFLEDGTPIKSYVPEAEIYQLMDGTWYDFEGNPD